MQITLDTKSYAAVETEALVTYLFEENDPIQGRIAEIDGAAGGLLKKLATGGEINGKDVQSLKAAADALKKANIAPYLVFSKTADEFLPREIDLFRTTRKEGYDVVLFTNAELEPYHPYYESADKDQLPVPYAHSFDDLVANTEFRYLR